MNKRNVAISYKNGPFINAKKALSALNLQRIKGSKVLIKPNIGRAAHPGQGINTYPDTVAGVS